MAEIGGHQAKESQVLMLLELSSSDVLNESHHLSGAGEDKVSNRSWQPQDPNFSSNNQNSNNNVMVADLISLCGWENSINPLLSSPSSHLISPQNSSQSLTSKSSTSSQISYSRSCSTTKSLKTRASSLGTSSQTKSVVRSYIEPKPIPYKFEHHDERLIQLHIDRYKKSYTYPNMEQRSQANENQVLLNASSRRAYSTTLVTPKLYILGDGNCKRPPGRHGNNKQSHRSTPSNDHDSSPVSSTSKISINYPLTFNHQSSCPSARSQRQYSYAQPFGDSYDNLKTQYRTILVQSSLSDADSNMKYRHSSIPRSQPIKTDTKNKRTQHERISSAASTSSARDSAVNMLWVPGSKTPSSSSSSNVPVSSNLTITSLKSTSSLCPFVSPSPPPPQPQQREVTPSATISRESRLSANVSQKLKNQLRKRQEVSRNKSTQHELGVKEYGKGVFNASVAVRDLSNSSSYLPPRPVGRVGQTVLLKHRNQVNFRNKQPAFRYEALEMCLPGHATNAHTSSAVPVATGPWISPY